MAKADSNSMVASRLNATLGMVEQQEKELGTSGSDTVVNFNSHPTDIGIKGFTRHDHAVDKMNRYRGWSRMVLT